MKIKMILLAGLLLTLGATDQLRAVNNPLGTSVKAEPETGYETLQPEPLAAPKPLPDLVFSSVEYTEGGKSTIPGHHTAQVIFCVKNVGDAPAGSFQVRLTVYKSSAESSGLHGSPKYFNFGGGLAPGQTKCRGKETTFENNKPIFTGRGRLLWIDPGNVGVVKESNEGNNKSWSNFPPKGVN